MHFLHIFCVLFFSRSKFCQCYFLTFSTSVTTLSTLSRPACSLKISNCVLCPCNGSDFWLRLLVGFLHFWLTPSDCHSVSTSGLPSMESWGWDYILPALEIHTVHQFQFQFIMFFFLFFHAITFVFKINSKIHTYYHYPPCLLIPSWKRKGLLLASSISC